MSNQAAVLGEVLLLLLSDTTQLIRLTGVGVAGFGGNIAAPKRRGINARCALHAPKIN